MHTEVSLTLCHDKLLYILRDMAYQIILIVFFLSIFTYFFKLKIDGHGPHTKHSSHTKFQIQAFCRS